MNYLKISLIAFFAVVVSFLFLPLTQAQAVLNSEVTFQPSSGLNDGTDEGSVSGGKDTYISSTRYGDFDTDLGSSVNFGTRAELIFDYYASYDGYPLLKFDVSTLPSDVVSAKLYLYSTANCGGGSCPNMDWTVNAITSPWDEMTATWNTRPTLSGGYGALNIPASPSALNEPGHDQWVSVDITDLYNGWKNGTIANYGIGFTRLGSAWDGGVWFNNVASSDYEIASLRPKLIIESGFPQTDTQPPTITAPADITVTAGSPDGVSGIDLGTPVVFDAVDPNPSVTNDAPAVFPIGTTAVIWTAKDQSNNSSSAAQNVIVLPPPGYTGTGVNVPIVLESGVTLIFSSITGSGITSITTSSAGPALPTQFKLGNPPIYYDINTTAVYNSPVEVCFSYAGVNYQNENNLKLRHFDGANWVDVTKVGYPDTVNKIICGITDTLSPFAITELADEIPPTITVPGSIVAEANLLSGVTVSYDAFATDNVGVASFSCSPASGSIFPIGATNVNCDASDAAGNTATASFAVTVNLTVKIDIKPGSYPNTINPKSNGKIPVAILSTPAFNALTQINKTSLTFGKIGDEKSLSFCNANGEDANKDGLLDLVCHFQAQQANFQIGNTEGKLKGKTVGNVPLAGNDSVRLVPAN